MKTSFAIIFTLAAAVLAAPTEIQRRGAGKSSGSGSGSGSSSGGSCPTNQVAACCDQDILTCDSIPVFAILNGLFGSSCSNSATVSCCSQESNQEGNLVPINIQNCAPLVEL